MTIWSKTIKLIHEYVRFEPRPRFGCVSRLCVTLCDLKLLPSFLESCPNLKSLVLKWEASLKHLELMNSFGFSSAPKCLLSSLEFVDFETTILGYYSSEMELVRYFLENSAILKKLSLRLRYYEKRQYDIYLQTHQNPKTLYHMSCRRITLF